MLGAPRWRLRPMYASSIGIERKFPYVHEMGEVGDFCGTAAAGVSDSVKSLSKVQGFDDFSKKNLANLTNKHFWCQKIKEAMKAQKNQLCGDENKRFKGKKSKEKFCGLNDDALNAIAEEYCKQHAEEISKAFREKCHNYDGEKTAKKVDYLLAKKLAQQKNEHYVDTLGVGDFNVEPGVNNEEELKEISSSLNDYKKQIGVLQQQLNVASSQIDSQNKVIEEGQDSKKVIEVLHEQIKKLEEQIEKLNISSNDLRKQLAEAHAEISAASSYKVENEELVGQLAQCRNVNNELNNHLKQVTEKVEELKMQLGSNASKNNQLAELQKNIDGLQSTIGVLKQEIQNRDNTIVQCKNAIMQLQNALKQNRPAKSNSGGGGILGSIIGGIGKLFGVGNLELPAAQDWEVVLHKVIIDGDPVDKEKLVRVLDDRIKNIKKVEIKERLNGEKLEPEEEEIKEILEKNKLPAEVEEKLEREAVKELKEENPVIEVKQQEEKAPQQFLGKKRAAGEPLILSSNNLELEEKIELAFDNVNEGITNILSVPENNVRNRLEIIKNIIAYCFSAIYFIKKITPIAPILQPELKPLSQQIEVLLGQLLIYVNALINANQINENDLEAVQLCIDSTKSLADKIVKNYFKN